MPLQKPSPYRFIAPAAPPPTQTPRLKPKSNLRHAVTAHAHTPQASPQLQSKNLTPARRFVVAPVRAGDAGTPRAAPDRVEERGGTGAAYAPRAKVGRKLARVESIEEASQSQSSSLRAGDDEEGILRSVEDGGMSDDDHHHHHHRGQRDTAAPPPHQHVSPSPSPSNEDASDAELLFEPGPRPKRRRTSPPSPTPNAARAACPATPKTPLPPPPPAHRFRLPPPTFTTPAPFSAIPTTPSSATATAAPLSRPSFLLPRQTNPRSPSQPPAPLPEIFSPSRKTGKFLSGGHAQTVQRWLVEAATMAQAGTAGASRSREDGVRLRVRITELGSKAQEVDCFTGGVVLARGTTEPGMHNASRVGEGTEALGTRLLLAGQGGARGVGVKVRIGDVVGVKAPTWDVDVGGEKWVVGVEWVIL